MLWKRSLQLTFLLSFTFCFGQTQLSAGDIYIIGLDCESEDFMFVTFVPLEAGTEIYFTDEEANGSYQIGLGEGTVLYTVPEGGLTRGTVISYKTNYVDFTNTFDGAIALANSGDGLIAYQGASVGSVSVFLDALGIDDASIGTFPGGFSGNVLGRANGQYRGIRAGLNRTSYVVKIVDMGNWQLDDASVMPFDISSFSFDTTPIIYSSKKEVHDLGYDFQDDSEIIEIVIQGEQLLNEIEIQAPSQFEISTSMGGLFSDHLSLTPVSGTVSASSVFIRLKENLGFDTYIGALLLSSSGAESIMVSLTGTSRMGYQNYCSDLFISEYIEGSSNNKFIEIFNPTVNDIRLDNNYLLEIYSNGNSTATRSINLEGTVKSNDVFVIEHPSESLGVNADQQSGSLNFNGNDAIVLKKSDQVLDVIGQVGFDPVTEWLGIACSSGTQDGGLIRRSEILNGVRVEDELFEVDKSWHCTAMDDVSDLGIHTIDNPSKLTVWDGVSWANGIPDENDVALIAGDYDTEIDGILNSCMLFISKNVSVNVRASHPVVLEGDAMVKGELLVDSHASFIQINDSSNFTLVESGNAQIEKWTSELNNWYEYTYWSSPVKEIPIETALSASPSGRRFYFEAANYEDILAEVGNTGVYNSGSDGIDDNGDVWKIATGNMIPARGYAATMKPSGFVVGKHLFYFDGAFNNGEITSPVISNSGGIYNDWNFIGNPYPGALDAELFFKENENIISGALYLWSHNTPPSSTRSGNYAQNFSNSDYAIITGSGVNVAGGDGIIPESYVPSCQGFFVEAIHSGDVIFKNSMRAINPTSNSQFFKSQTKQKNQEDTVIWLDLRSDDGVFSQIAVGFFNKATNDDDGTYFDVQRKPNLSAGAVMYSRIEEREEKYAIQGRGLKRLNKSKVSLGIQSNFKEQSAFRIEVARKQGRFDKSLPVYLYDRLNNTLHDFKNGPYYFLLTEGVHDTRFELLFSKKGIKKNQFENQFENLVIRENEKGEIQFSVAPYQEIKSVQIYDMLGRQVYQFENVSQIDWFDISKIQNGIFISRVLLKNNKILSSKAIKRY